MKKIFFLVLLPLLISCSKGEDFYPGIALSVTVTHLNGNKSESSVYLYNIDNKEINDYTPKFGEGILGFPCLKDNNGDIINPSDLSSQNSGSYLFIFDYEKIGTVYLPKGKYLILVVQEPFKRKYSYKIIDIQSGPLSLKKVWQNDLEGYEEW